MTGTPLDLTPFGSAITAIGWLYWLLFAGALWWALRGKKNWKDRLWRVTPVLLIFSLIPGYGAYQSYVARARLQAATTQFELRCKSAGEFIRRTADSVDGVV